jgi:hypothetical protein
MKKQFIQFLKDNGALIPFICNLALLKKWSLTEYFKIYFEDELTNDWLISSSFTWVETTEGHDYWSFLSTKWKNTINY